MFSLYYSFTFTLRSRPVDAWKKKRTYDRAVKLFAYDDDDDDDMFGYNYCFILYRVHIILVCDTWETACRSQESKTTNEGKIYIDRKPGIFYYFLHCAGYALIKYILYVQFVGVSLSPSSTISSQKKKNNQQSNYLSNNNMFPCTRFVKAVLVLLVQCKYTSMLAYVTRRNTCLAAGYTQDARSSICLVQVYVLQVFNVK